LYPDAVHHGADREPIAAEVQRNPGQPRAAGATNLACIDLLVCSVDLVIRHLPRGGVDRDTIAVYREAAIKNNRIRARLIPDRDV
jgi:hypothetical protein